MSLSMLWDMWDTKEEVVGGLFGMFSEENVKQNIDENWSSLENIGVPEGLLQGKATTTEPDFIKSTANALYNLPSQVPRLAKDIVGAVYNPIELVEGVHGVGQGIMTNASDVFYDAVLPDSWFNKLKEYQRSIETDEMIANEEAMEFAGKSLLDPQVRREITQNYGLEGLLAYAALPSNALKLSALKNVDLDLNNLHPSIIPGSPNNLLKMFAEPRHYATMYHGSPRNFTALDNKFMLTGEGNNVKGAGFYMGGRASTSKQYFGEIDKYNQTYDTTDFDLFQDEVVARKREADHGANKSEIVSHMWKDVRDDTATPSEVSYLLEKYKDHPDLPKLKEAIKEYQQLWAEQPFSLMKFDVDDPYIDTFLNDAKGVYDQPEAVKNLLRQESGAYMDLVEAYKKNSGNKIEQDKIVAEINELGDFPHPDNGIDLYDFFVDRRAEHSPSADMGTHNLKVSEWLHTNGVMGRRWEDDLSTKYPDLYDSENYLIFDAKTAEMLERNEVPVNPMIAQHNVRDEDVLEKHLDANGIPMPSIAISRADNPTTNFGEITLLGSSDMITPSKDTVVYPTDMYSGRAPDDRVVYKDPEGVLDMVDPDKLRFFANVKPLDNPDELYTGGGISQMQGRTNREYVNDKARRKLDIKEHHTGLLERQIATVDEAIKRGFDPYKYPTYREAIYDINNTLHDQGLPLISAISSDMIPREGLLGETVRTMTNPKGYRTPTGKERPDVPYSAAEALKIMKKKKAFKPGVEGHTGFNQTYALSSSPFKSLQEIKDNRGLLNDKQGMSEGDSTELFELDLEMTRDAITEITSHSIGNDIIDDVLRTGKIHKDDYNTYKIDAVQAKQIEEIILRLKDKNRKLLSDEFLKENPQWNEQGLMDTSGLLATDYFEAKPKKIIDIAEFKGAIIPKETKPKIIELLKQKGIKKILTYGSEAERIKLFKKFPELQFIGLAMPMGLLSGEEEQRNGLLL